MGADGGTIPKRIELVKNKKREEKVRKTKYFRKLTFLIIDKNKFSDRTRYGKYSEVENVCV